ncbi:MAG TPA: RNA polymerase sigma factor [Acidimicrobiales bacterium]|nr:RNA polymerase sigma factor [Acidimicrobiales bacterium]
MGIRRRASAVRSVDAVYDALAPAVLGYFRSHRLPDPEGLTGDVFVSVARRLGTFEGDDDALRRWVFTIAHNRGVDETRRRARRPDPVPLDDGVDVPAPHVVDDLDPALLAALAALTPDQREVVVLRHVADLSVAGVARTTGRSEGSVKMLCARGLEALAAHLRVATSD